MFKGAREAFGWKHEKSHYGNFRPFQLAKVLTQQDSRELTQARFYQGMPDPRRDKRGNAITNRRIAAWQRDSPDLLKITTRTLRYPPTEGREKGIDVQLAIDLVSMAYDDEYDLAVLASADTDLIPAVQFVVERYPLKLVECVAWEPLPECADDAAAPLDVRTKGVLRRMIPQSDWDTCSDKRDFTRMQDVSGPMLPGQSGRQLPPGRG